MKSEFPIPRSLRSSGKILSPVLGLRNAGAVFVLLALSLVVIGAGCRGHGHVIEPPPDEVSWPLYCYFDPTWSPTGRHIAYGRGHVPGDTLNPWGLYVYDLVDSTIAWLIDSSVQRIPLQFDISPDGRWIAFTWYSQIWKCLITGDSLVQLTSGGSDVGPAWSPNGQRIAYRGVAYGTHIINVDGSSDTLVAKGAYPQWLDEGRIVYVGLYAHIYTLDLETGIEERIFERLPEWVGDSVRELEADATGTRLLFSAFNPGEHPNVFRLELGTYQLTQLTTTGGDQPSWSPDGAEIVYTNTQVGRIWIMSADGSNKRPLFKE